MNHPPACYPLLVLVSSYPQEWNPSPTNVRIYPCSTWHRISDTSCSPSYICWMACSSTTASSDWPASPGTGVFLPSQGSGNSTNQPAVTENNSIEISAKAEEHSAGKSDGSCPSPNVDDETTQQEYNLSSDEMNRGAAILKEEQENSSGAV